MASGRESGPDPVQHQVETLYRAWGAKRDWIQAQFDLEIRKLDEEYRSNKQVIEAEFIRSMRVVGAPPVSGGATTIEKLEQVLLHRKNAKTKLLESEIQERRTTINNHFNKELLAHHERISDEILNCLMPPALRQNPHPHHDALSSGRLPPSPNHALVETSYGRQSLGSNADRRPPFAEHARQSSQAAPFQGADYPRHSAQPRVFPEADFVMCPPVQRRSLREEYKQPAGPDRQHTRWINTTNPNSVADGKTKRKADARADAHLDEENPRRTRMWPRNSPVQKTPHGIQGIPIVDKSQATAEVEKTKPPTPRPPPKTPLVKRTIDFNEVYQDGDAEYKHIIISYPAGEKFDWYILKCDEHGVHFNLNPLHGAAKHLHSSQHNNMSKEHALAIQELGHMVWDCTKELADKNNAAVKEAFAKGYKPFNRNQLTKTERRSMGFPVPETIPARRTQSTAQAQRRKEKAAETAHNPHSSPGIFYPVPGEMYLGYWSKSKTRYAVMVLPWGSLECVGVADTLKATGLTLVHNKPPKCYTIDRQSREILSWAEGYEDGGRLVSKREFPVMYFDQSRSVGWMAGKDLSLFDFEDPAALEKIPQYEVARDSYAATRPEKFESYQRMKEYYAAKGLPPKLLSDVETPPVIDISAGGSDNTESGVKESEGPVSKLSEGIKSPRPEGAAYTGPTDVEMADAARADDTETSHDSDPDDSPDSDDDVEMTNAESRRTSVSNKGVGRDGVSAKEAADNSSSDRPGTGQETTGLTDESGRSDMDNAPAAVLLQTTENRHTTPKGSDDQVKDSTTGVSSARRESDSSSSTLSGSRKVIKFHARKSSDTGASQSPTLVTKDVANTTNVAAVPPSSPRTEDSIVLPPRQTTIFAPGPQPDARPEAAQSPVPDTRPAETNALHSDRTAAPARAPTSQEFQPVQTSAEASHRLSDSLSSISSPRSISPTPLAGSTSHSPSRTNSPTIIRPQEAASADRWRVIGSESGPVEAPPSPPKTQVEKPTEKTLSITTTSPTATAKELPSMEMPAAATTQHGSSRNNTPIPTRPTAQEIFEIAYYEDDSGFTFHKQDAGRVLRLAGDKTTGTIVAAEGQDARVKIDPQAVERMDVHMVSEDPTAACMVTLDLKEGTPKKQELVFEAGNCKGRDELGRIHARHFCRWMKVANPAIDYRNFTTNHSSRPATGYVRS